MATILQNHYVLAVHQLAANARFFEALGFAITSEPPGWVFLQRDNCMVMLGECGDAIPPHELGDHSYFGYLRVDDVDQYYAEVRANAVTIHHPLADKPWSMREFGVISPEGHRLMIGQWIGDR
ncbi:Glyoxalase/Bleomycin resistance protein/Dioxygenase superfamily protein [Catalinimonas alkaloidigena]|uniref:Glyoxalase/Bleomycin resistance protein/Dioxygenase superfamily protein n=1 Tax=Catalinimonas alkaloidigena TaxID=1075417 RepID=A0A1G8X468_9BACT|nr:VOC family protein [Catalinimonas alkaloidigena]SDJ85428.1 Glyoxalase/Bleomycin resistance protein/Dioxygenase superfamily protein [Catalinimonas alkaloidigena]